MQVPKRHFPVVGLVGLVLIAAAAGSVYYYQFVRPHNPATCGVPVHRVIFLRAIIKEDGGFSITGAATVNQSVTLPTPHNQTSASFNFTGIKFSNETVTDPKTIVANVGDIVTVYMFAFNSTDPAQYPPAPPSTGLGHGFGVDQFVIPAMHLVTWNTWGATSFTVPNAPGLATFRCLHNCSNGHSQMTGNLQVNGCG